MDDSDDAQAFDSALRVEELTRGENFESAFLTEHPELDDLTREHLDDTESGWIRDELFSPWDERRHLTEAELDLAPPCEGTEIFEDYYVDSTADAVDTYADTIDAEWARECERLADSIHSTYSWRLPVAAAV